MLRSKPIPEWRECNHLMCNETCRREKPAPKPRKPLNRKTPIKKRFKAKDGADELNAWFLSMRDKMTGFCADCGYPTLKHDDKFYKYSIAHVLPKRETGFPSISMNENNWIELCYFGNSCHHRYDSNWSNASKMRIWNTVIERFKLLYPSIDPSERKFIPDVLQEHIPK